MMEIFFDLQPLLLFLSQLNVTSKTLITAHSTLLDFSFYAFPLFHTPNFQNSHTPADRLSCISPSVGTPLHNISTVHTTSSFLT